jgi:hypothetical protein
MEERITKPDRFGHTRKEFCYVCFSCVQVLSLKAASADFSGKQRGQERFAIL